MEQITQKRNLNVLAGSQFFAGLFGTITQAVWQPFVLSLGAPMSAVGLLESIGGAHGIVTALIQPVGGWLSDRMGRKPLILLGGLAALLGTALCVLAAATRQWRWLLAGITLIGMGLLARPARDTIIAESASVRQRGMAYSIQTAAWVLPGAFAPALGGWIASRTGFTPVFVIRLALEGLRLLLLGWLLRETLGRGHSALDWKEMKGVLARMFWPPGQLRGLYWAMAIDVFAWGLGSTLIFGMLTESRGYTTVQLGIMASLFSAVWGVTQLPIGRLVDRYGFKPFLVLSEGLGLLLLVGWLLGRSFVAFALLHAFFGFTASLWVPAQQGLFVSSVPAGERGEAMGRFAAFLGIVSFSAPFFGGLLYDRWGFSAPILANLVLAVGALVAIWALVREPPAEETAQGA